MKNETGDGHEGDIRGLQLAIAMYASGLRPKLAAYYVTGVMALFAEALHTLSDIFISGFLLLAALVLTPRSRRAAHVRLRPGAEHSLLWLPPRCSFRSPASSSTARRSRAARGRVDVDQDRCASAAQAHRTKEGS